MQENCQALYYLYRILYTFHMNAFFFLSGITYILFEKDKNILEFTIKKFRALIVPWICFSAVLYLIFLIGASTSIGNKILSGTSYELISISEYIKQTLACNNPYGYHVWFMLILFLVQIFVALIDMILKKKEVSDYNFILIYILLCVAIMIIDIFAKPGYDCLGMFLTRVPYYILGILFAYCKLYNKHTSNSFVFILGLISFGLLLFCIVVGDMFNQNYLFRALRIVIASPLAILFMVFAAKNVEDNHRAFNKLLEWFGKNSFNIYLLHQPFCCALLGMLLMKYLPGDVISYLFIILVCIFASVLFPVVICKLLKMLRLEKLAKVLFNLEVDAI